MLSTPDLIPELRRHSAALHLHAHNKAYVEQELRDSADLLLEAADRLQLLNRTVPPEQFVLEFLYRTDGGPELVGPFESRAAAKFWFEADDGDYAANIRALQAVQEALKPLPDPSLSRGTSGF